MEVRIKKLNQQAVLPAYAHATDAGMDLTATSFEFDKATGCFIYGTGIAMEIPEGYVGLVFPRSSVYKTNFTMSNCVGVIDSGYRGEIKFIFRNTYSITQFKRLWHRILFFLTGKYQSWHINRCFLSDGTNYKVGDRIGQIIILPYPQINFVQVDNLNSTDRGEGGHGSTGK